MFNIPSILVFMSSTFKMIEELKSINDGLQTWYTIVPFFNIVKYKNEDHFKELISTLDFHVKDFYVTGANFFSPNLTLVIQKILTLICYVFICLNMQKQCRTDTNQAWGSFRCRDLKGAIRKVKIHTVDLLIMDIILVYKI